MISIEVTRGKFDAAKICKKINDVSQYFEGESCRVDITFDLPVAKGSAETRIPCSIVVRDAINAEKEKHGFVTTDATLRHMLRIFKIYYLEAGVLFIKSERKRDDSEE